MKRRIIEIDENLCNGCELCVTACHEHAIQMVDGKAKLVSDIYCDGLGDCLPNCPTDAIKMIERDALEYDQEAVDQRIKANLGHEEASEVILSGHGHHGAHGASEDNLPCGCPGSMSKRIERQAPEPVKKGMTLAPKSAVPTNLGADAHQGATHQPLTSALGNWPVQLNLVNPQAEYLKGADLLIAADCTAFAYADFHRDFIQGRVALIGCPKLDDNNYYIEKLKTIFAQNAPKSITVVRMEVPCCGGIVTAVKQAMLQSQTIVPYNEVTITLDGHKR